MSKHVPEMQLKPLSHAPSLHAQCSLPEMQLGPDMPLQLLATSPTNAATIPADARIASSVNDVSQTGMRVIDRELSAIGALTNCDAFTTDAVT
jgi:hypothetical protein